MAKLYTKYVLQTDLFSHIYILKKKNKIAVAYQKYSLYCKIVPCLFWLLQYLFHWRLAAFSLTIYLIDENQIESLNLYKQREGERGVSFTSISLFVFLFFFCFLHGPKKYGGGSFIFHFFNVNLIKNKQIVSVYVCVCVGRGGGVLGIQVAMI